VRRHKAARTDKTARPHEDISPAGTPAQIPPGDWAGATIQTPPNDSFQMVFGQWVVPTVSPKNPSGEDLSLAFWVGLGGSIPNGGGQLLQAGVTAIVDSGQGSVTWQAWTEWYDDYYHNPARPVSNFPVAPGDSVAVLVCAPEPSLGHVTMINLSRQPQLLTNVSIPAPGQPGQFIGQLELTDASPRVGARTRCSPLAE
jgi:Peptidase A4 family